MTEPGTELILPSGEIVALADTAACAVALDELRALEHRIKDLKTALTEAVASESARQGTKTLSLPGGVTVIIRDGEKVMWDAQRLEADLREAGMPEERIRQIVVEEISYTVQAREAKRAAAANPDYAHAVAAARSTLEGRPSVTVKRA